MSDRSDRPPHLRETGDGETPSPRPRLAQSPSGSYRVQGKAVPTTSGVLLVLAGEIDQDSAHEVRRMLEAALRAGPGNLELDLTAVTFCDSSGLNAVLAVRRAAESDGRRLVVQAAGPRVRHLFDLTGASSVLGLSDP
ncbi:STAS domain-containing protein [Kitasatospora paranensis]|uniref:Anti-sigma factor antagonist n=1 Tax=Kitasatospora paranensis TaxID=258053 RepID=A0ABW2GA28_9ACTN